MPSPSPTASPTPTPPPLTVRVESLLPAEAPPVPVANAACGVVDRLDFPLGPPSGDGYQVRWQYGRDSRRYGKIHAGEDWLALDGPSLGRPVYSIGHGQVSYANGLGWGRDQGVVIIRHMFPDGSQRLSQYGHLEPESVTVSPGDCVSRGDQVGRIGDPKTRPHLHFEIRSHLPGEPGPGYWGTNPSDAGWEHPSWYIWQQRMASAPGVIWTRPWESASTDMIGEIGDAGTLVVLADGTLTGLDPSTGQSDWQLPAPSELLGADVTATSGDSGAEGTAGTRRDLGLTPIEHGGWCDAAVDLADQAAGGGRVYALSCTGHVAAVALLASPGNSASPERAWSHALPAGLAVNGLMPRPGGGVYAAAGRTLVELTPDGREASRHTVGVPDGWSVASDRLLVSTRTEGTHMLKPGTRPVRVSDLEGTPVLSADWDILVADDGLYSRQATAAAAPDPIDAPDSLAPLRPLESGNLSLAWGAGLPDGGALVTHRTLRQIEILRLDADGRPAWARALPGGVGLWSSSGQGWFGYGARVVPPVPLVGPRGAYLLMDSGHVLALDTEAREPAAQLILDPGNGPRIRGESAAFAAGNGLLVIDARTGLLIGLDPSRVTGDSVRAPGGDAGG